MKCPNCQSENTRRFSVIHDEGMTHKKTTTKTDGLLSVGKEIGSYGGTTETETTSLTSLARRCAPPKEPSEPAGPISRFLGAVFGGLVMCAAVFMVLAVIDEIMGQVIWRYFGGRMDYFAGVLLLLVAAPTFVIIQFAARQTAHERAEYNRSYPALRTSWERSWLCMKCGRDYAD